MTTPANPTPCPRCGYDQSGTIATWADSCPTRGVCSECGLEFEWANLLNPFRGRLPGLLEHARGLRQTFRWTFTTFGWMLLPHRFWNRVQMHHTIRLWPIALAAILFALLAQAAAGLGGLALSFADPQINWSLDRSHIWWPHVVTPFVEPFMRIERIQYAWGASMLWIEYPIMGTLVRLAALCACILAWPLLFIALPTTRHEAKLRWAHVARAAAYPFLWVVLLLVLDRTVAIGNIALGALSRIIPATLIDRYVLVVDPLISGIAISLWILAPLWVGAWWYFAINTGWKLERGRLLWLLLCIAAASASALVATGVWYLREVNFPTF
jgi:hypothetical protein